MQGNSSYENRKHVPRFYRGMTVQMDNIFLFLLEIENNLFTLTIEM